MNISVNKVVMAGTALLLAVGMAACSGGGGTPGSNQSDASVSETAGELFSESEYNFQITLPKTPTAQPVNQEVDGVIITGNIYLVEISNEEAYVVGVSRYELTDPDTGWDDRLSLEGAVEGMVTNVDGTIVSTENESTLLGYPASKTVFTVPNPGGDPLEGRAQMVIRDQTLYNIMGMGVSEKDFNAAVESFSFLD